METIKKLKEKISKEGGLNPLNLLEAKLTQTKEIIKLIKQRIKYCKSKLEKDFEKDKIWMWRISGFEEIISQLKGNYKHPPR